MNASDIEQPAMPQPKAPPSSAWRKGAIAIGLVGGGFVLGAVSLASAGGMPWHGGFHHHGPGIGMIQHVVRGALDNVGASTAQEDKIHDILAATYTDLDKNKNDHEVVRKQLIDLMKAPTIDRAAVDKLRAEKISEMDAKSKTIMNAVLDAAGQLTPEQRAKLAQHAEERMAHGDWDHDGWHHGEGMDGPEGRGHGHGDHGRDGDGDHEPEGGDHG